MGDRVGTEWLPNQDKDYSKPPPHPVSTGGTNNDVIVKIPVMKFLKDSHFSLYLNHFELCYLYIFNLNGF